VADDALQDDLTALDGIGPALSARLRACGIGTVEDLARARPGAVLAGLAGIRGLSLERVEGWIAQARERRAGSRASQTLILTIEVDGGLSVTVTNARTGQERAWGRWQGREVLGFIEHELGLAPVAGTTGRAAPPSTAGRAGEGSSALDLGLSARMPRTLDCRIDTSGLAAQGVGGFSYTASLRARELGDAAATTIAQSSGAARAGEPLALTFAPPEPAPAVRRLSLVVSVAPPPPDGTRPALALLPAEAG
jgi:Helix-hairpin-helix domain